MSLGSIPWTAARQYADCHGMTGEEFYLLWECVKALDSRYLQHYSDQHKPKKVQPDGHKTNRRNRH